MASIETVATAPALPYDQIAELSGQYGLPVWADDNAGRQLLRARGIATFSSLELLEELSSELTNLNLSLLTEHLAAEFYVDLPLSGASLIRVGRRYGWGGAEEFTPIQTQMARSSLWTNRFREATNNSFSNGETSWAEKWSDDWSRVCIAAASDSPEAWQQYVLALCVEFEWTYPQAWPHASIFAS